VAAFHAPTRLISALVTWRLLRCITPDARWLLEPIRTGVLLEELVVMAAFVLSIVKENGGRRQAIHSFLGVDCPSMLTTVNNISSLCLIYCNRRSLVQYCLNTGYREEEEI
jgi:hypothetical protein